MRNVLLVAGALPLFILACEASPDGRSATGEGRVSVSTSALSLPGISDACYDLEVTNERGDVVWTQRDVCSSSYGDERGGVTYVGPCDASSKRNTVSLTLTGMKDASGAPFTNVTNPCPRGAACTKEAACTENADTSVAFDLTVMRSADQGFFDVAVSIDDVSCSATLACKEGLLSDPVTGERAETAVLGFACTGGEGAMWMSDVTLDCDSPRGPISIVVDPSGGSGLLSKRQHSPTPLVKEVGVWHTTSPMSSSWSVGIAPDLSALDEMGVTSCRLHAAATATDETSSSWQPPEHYPLVSWDMEVISPRDVATGQSSGKRLALSCPSSGGVTTKSVSGGHKPIGHVTIVK